MFKLSASDMRKVKQAMEQPTMVRLGAAVDAFNTCMDKNKCRDKRFVSMQASIRASKKAMFLAVVANKMTDAEYRAKSDALAQTASAMKAVERHNTCALESCRKQLLDVLQAFVGVNEASLKSLSKHDPAWVARTRAKIVRLKGASLWTDQELRQDLSRLLTTIPNLLY